mgnify:CR=1 FL=1
MAEHHLDCKGLNCPMPIVRLSQAMRPLPPGSRLVVEADDPAFRADVEAWVRRFGHTLVRFDAGPVQRAIIEKK